MRVLRAVLAGSLLLGWALAVPADTVVGVPVTSIGGTQSVPNCPTLEGQVCYNAGTGTTTFYIPISASHAGVFGVTSVSGGTAGTFADAGTGTANALTMFLQFSPVVLPVGTATLTLNFIDLDLVGVNDPSHFFETVQFFSSTGSPLTPIITSNGQSGSSPIPWVVSGNSTAQTIYFSNVTSIIQNPFYIQLNFGSQYNTTGINTPEQLTATLQTTPVPEPATLLLLGTGLVGAGLKRFRRR